MRPRKLDTAQQIASSMMPSGFGIAVLMRLAVILRPETQDLLPASDFPMLVVEGWLTQQSHHNFVIMQLHLILLPYYIPKTVLKVSIVGMYMPTPETKLK